MLRIVLTGPESSGKTTLTQQLAAHYGAPWVPEYARTYLQKLSRDYEKSDLLEIAKGQLFREERIGAGNPALLLCDTDLLTLKIWSEVKYGEADPWILEQVNQREYSHYFLCGVDIPWEYDPQREHPEQREELYRIYRAELLRLGKSFSELRGSVEERVAQAIGEIDARSILEIDNEQQ